MDDEKTTQETEETTVETTETAENQANEQPETSQNAAGEKTFTQEEVNKLIAKAKKSERAKAESNKKSDSERITDLENRLADSERRNAIASSGCNSEFADFVKFKVGSMDGDFAENLNTFKAENPQYFGSKSENTVKVSSSPTLSGGTAKTRESILAIKDEDERQKAIAENIGLFKNSFS